MAVTRRPALTLTRSTVADDPLAGLGEPQTTPEPQKASPAPRTTKPARKTTTAKTTPPEAPAPPVARHRRRIPRMVFTSTMAIDVRTAVDHHTDTTGETIVELLDRLLRAELNIPTPET